MRFALPEGRLFGTRRPRRSVSRLRTLAGMRVGYGVAPNMDTPNPEPGEEFTHVNTQLFGIIDPPTNCGLCPGQ